MNIVPSLDDKTRPVLYYVFVIVAAAASQAVARETVRGETSKTTSVITVGGHFSGRGLGIGSPGSQEREEKGSV